LGHDPTKLNIKGRLKNNFQTASLYRKQPARSKIKVQAAFCDDWKKRALFLYCILCRHNAKQHYSGLNLNQYGVASPCRTICTVCGFVALS